MPQWHCRARTRVVESGPGQVLAAGEQQKLEALPDPYSHGGRVTRWPAWSRSRCAFTAAEGPARCGRAVYQAAQLGGPGPAASSVRPDGRPVPCTG